MIYRKLFLALAGLMLAVSGTAVAQDDEHGLINVRTTVVKPGTAPEYLELMSQLAASRSAAGHSGVDMWQVVRGPVGTFYSVTYIDSYSVFDTAFDSGMSEGDWARWIGRITAVIDHSVLTTLRTHPELAVPPAAGSAPNLVQLRFTTLEPGSGADHHEWLANSLVPNMKEGNASGWSVSEVRLGDDVNTWISAMRIDSWAQLDEPGPFSHMSERARDNMLEDYFDRAVSARVEIIRHLPDQSY